MKRRAASRQGLKPEVSSNPEIKQDVENSNCTEECTENSIDATKETTDEPKSAVKDRLERENNKKRLCRKEPVLSFRDWTSLSALRQEINHVDEIIANDLLGTAVESIKRNVVHNGVEGIVKPHQGDACQVMYRTVGTDERYDVVDLDPYGSAAPFLDGAVQSVADGLLCITCTDMAVLAGSQPESCWAKYGGINIPGTVHPRNGLVISYTLYKLIRGTIDGGAFYSHPIHDSEFLARMLDHVARASPSQYGTHTRMADMLTVQSECRPANAQHWSAIIHAGFEVSQSHAARAAIKTTAPANIIWDIMRCWCKQHPPSEKNMSPNSPARKLLATESKIVANFEKHPASPDSYKYNLVRHQENPTANWGPKV
ncbi:hypothetical protein BSLG_005396 [Batrachochytrium salamandrivorans]|nr:hypothetical protein BSLG_005396 [Batrachochytrium salamandrivorans]